MKNAVTYTAMINAEDGIHVFRTDISDPDAEYEAFEFFAQEKADNLGGELFGPYCEDDIVETVDVPASTEVNPDDLYASAGDDTPDAEAELDAEIDRIRKDLFS